MKIGYGYYKLEGKSRLAHRIAYEALVSAIPRHLVCDHLCENKKCVNPNHIEVVTDRVNILRGPAPSAQNAKKTHCIRGHKFELGSYYSSQGWRDCKKCKAINDQSRKSRKGLQNAS
ncbi:HNH endonuclease [Rhodococcus qingshengii]|uniref:HNH endonuclease n=1 Tax=Rhodococcus qingshengii TaxID=334542 RepID=UPI003AFAB62C